MGPLDRGARGRESFGAAGFGAVVRAVSRGIIDDGPQPGAELFDRGHVVAFVEVVGHDIEREPGIAVRPLEEVEQQACASNPSQL